MTDRMMFLPRTKERTGKIISEGTKNKLSKQKRETQYRGGAEAAKDVDVLRKGGVVSGKTGEGQKKKKKYG